MPDFTEPEDEAFFAAIGRLTISWAYIDAGLETLVRTIHHELGGRDQIEKDEPVALKRRLDYLRRAFRRLPELASFTDRFTPIADEIVAASVQRHDIIHGAILHMASGSGKAAMLRVLPGTKRPKPFIVSTNDVLSAAMRANKIQMLAFIAEVMRATNRSAKISTR